MKEMSDPDASQEELLFVAMFAKVSSMATSVHSSDLVTTTMES